MSKVTSHPAETEQEASDQLQSWVPWYKHLTKYEQEIVAHAFPSEISQVMRVHLFYANFILDHTDTYLAGERISSFPVDLYKKIQGVCADRLGYVPMICNNNRFGTDVSILTERPLLPDLTFRNIFSGQILGYREKVDGELVWRSTVAYGSKTYEMHVGAICMPASIQSDVFELAGLTASSISPFNAKFSVFFPGAEIRFEERHMHPSPDPSWDDGAVAILWQDGKPVERRVKRIQSSELQFNSGVTHVTGASYSCVHPTTGVPLQGIYECVMEEGAPYPIAYRPFKTHDSAFMHKQNLPDILQAPTVNYGYVPSALGWGVFGTTVRIPYTCRFPHVIASPILSDNSVVLQAYDDRSNLVQSTSRITAEGVECVVGTGSRAETYLLSHNSARGHYGNRKLRFRYVLAHCVISGPVVEIVRAKNFAVAEFSDGRHEEFDPPRVQGIDHLISDMSREEFARVFSPTELPRERDNWRKAASTLKSFPAASESKSSDSSSDSGFSTPDRAGTPPLPLVPLDSSRSETVQSFRPATPPHFQTVSFKSERRQRDRWRDRFRQRAREVSGNSPVLAWLVARDAGRYELLSFEHDDPSCIESQCRCSVTVCLNIPGDIISTEIRPPMKVDVVRYLVRAVGEWLQGQCKVEGDSLVRL